MAIEQIDQLEPRKFLDYVLQTPYSEDDWIDEIAHRIAEAVFDVLRAIGAPFICPFFILHRTYQYLSFNFLNAQNGYVLKHDWVEKIPKNAEGLIYQQKILHALNMTQRLAKQMGIGPVRILRGKQSQGFADAVSDIHHRFIKLNFDVFTLSEEEIEFLIAHELAHLEHRDIAKRIVFSWVILGLQLIAFRYLNVKRAFGAGMLIWAIGEKVGRTMILHQEKMADERAMQVLNSNVGMVKYMHRDLKMHYKAKHMSKEDYQKIQPDGDFEKIKKSQYKITPQGNYRYDYTHPPMTERLAHALSFQPVSVT